MNFSLGTSQLAGWVGDFLAGLGDAIISPLRNMFEAYMDLLSNVFYVIFIGLASLIDLVQLLFRKLAGLDVYKYAGDTTVSEGDIVVALITSDAVMNIFYTLLILAFVLLLVSTFIAVLKSEYAPVGDKGKKSMSKIFGGAFRAMLNFLVVPVVVVFGLIVSNGLLRSLDLATTPSQTPLLSGRIFQAAAYNANRARFQDNFVSKTLNGFIEYEEGTFNNGINNFGIFTGTDEMEVAALIDYQFANRAAVPEGYEDEFALNPEKYDIQDLLEKFGGSYPDTFSIYNVRLVWFYYDISSFNFIVGIGMAIALFGILLQTMIGLIKRLFSLSILFMISPPILAITPINEGAFGQWKKAFIGDALNAYSVIVVLNLFLMLLPVIGEIQFFPITASMNEAEQIYYMGLNYFAQMMVILGGTVFFKDFTKTLSGMIGAGDAFGEGAGKAKDFTAKAAKAAAIGLGAGALAGGITKMGAKAVKGTAKGAFKGTRGATNWAKGYRGKEGKERLKAIRDERAKGKAENKAAKAEKRANSKLWQGAGLAKNLVKGGAQKVGGTIKAAKDSRAVAALGLGGLGKPFKELGAGKKKAQEKAEAKAQQQAQIQQHNMERKQDRQMQEDQLSVSSGGMTLGNKISTYKSDLKTGVGNANAKHAAAKKNYNDVNSNQKSSTKQKREARQQLVNAEKAVQAAEMRLESEMKTIGKLEQELANPDNTKTFADFKKGDTGQTINNSEEIKDIIKVAKQIEEMADKLKP